MARRVKHYFELDRDDPIRLAKLREQYMPDGDGVMGASKRMVVEFIEAYAELKGWDLDEFDKRIKPSLL